VCEVIGEYRGPFIAAAGLGVERASHTPVLNTRRFTPSGGRVDHAVSPIRRAVSVCRGGVSP
jgi:hypothetical protein